MKAIIPLAGKGTRLRPHTHHTPKPLLRVGGRPVMSYILDDLRELGIEEVVFITGYLGESIKEYIDKGSKEGRLVAGGNVDAKDGFYYDAWWVNSPQRKLAFEGMCPVVAGTAPSRRCGV